MAKRKKKKKNETFADVKKRVWKVFSEYIRKRDADENGVCKCVTCGMFGHWSIMQAGHFVGGRTNSVLFNEDIVMAQCVHCNIFKRGNYQEYTLHMIRKHGMKKVEKFLKLKHEIKKYTIGDMEKLEADLKRRIEEIEN